MLQYPEDWIRFEHIQRSYTAYTAYIYSIYSIYSAHILIRHPISRYESLREVAFSAQYERWRETTRELVNIDLTKLKEEERIPFFLNVAHCLILDRLLFKCKRGLPFVTNVLEGQIDDSLYAYEIGCMGVVTLLQVKINEFQNSKHGARNRHNLVS